MTAPDYVAQVAELLGEHLPLVDSSCLCGNSDRYLKPSAHRTHQAEVLAAAGLIPTRTEWGVRHSQGIRPERTERAATEALGPMTTAFERNFRNKTRPTVVSRAVTDWKDATDD
ncbi:hypothetical protein [Oerskovia paurometabola]|uniref:hypothetical protein n=1 Tax=Oerskovia paurometabola TaxID=162170 RepID=UPI0038175B95